MLLFRLRGMQRKWRYDRDMVKRLVWLGGTILRASAVFKQCTTRGTSNTTLIAGCQRNRLRKRRLTKRLLPNLRLRLAPAICIHEGSERALHAAEVPAARSLLGGCGIKPGGVGHAALGSLHRQGLLK